MKHKTTELEGQMLDAAMALIISVEFSKDADTIDLYLPWGRVTWGPSHPAKGASPQCLAAMRKFVWFRFGDEIDLPDAWPDGEPEYLSWLPDQSRSAP